MNNHKITPEKITRPFQLLAAWLTGLIILDGGFLYAAHQITQPSWMSGALVIAAIINVPIFLFCLFKLQTKYRPEMQEDIYYSKYIISMQGQEKKSNKQTKIANKKIKFLKAEYKKELSEIFQNLFQEQNINARNISKIKEETGKLLDKSISESVNVEKEAKRQSIREMILNILKEKSKDDPYIYNREPFIISAGKLVELMSIEFDPREIFQEIAFMGFHEGILKLSTKEHVSYNSGIRF